MDMCRKSKTTIDIVLEVWNHSIRMVNVDYDGPRSNSKVDRI